MAKYRVITSPLKMKKKRVYFMHGGKEVHVDFGHTSYEDYTQHKDPVRRRNYLTRSAGIVDGKGHPTKNDPLSPNYWSRRLLWASQEPFIGIM